MNTATKLMLGLLGGGASFSPLSIPGLALWLDASDASTLFQDSAGTTPAAADGDVVGYWGDKSGNGNHALQATTGNKPVLKLNAQNTLPALEFDGTDDVLAAPDAASLDMTALTAFVVRVGGASAARTLIAKRSIAGVPANYQYFANGNQWNGAVYTGPGVTIGAGTPVIWSFQQNGSQFWAYLNGALQGASPYANGLGVANGEALHIFGRAGEYSAGRCAEVLLYNTVLSAANRIALETYLNTKWAVFA